MQRRKGTTRWTQKGRVRAVVRDKENGGTGTGWKKKEGKEKAMGLAQNIRSPSPIPPLSFTHTHKAISQNTIQHRPVHNPLSRSHSRTLFLSTRSNASFAFSPFLPSPSPSLLLFPSPLTLVCTLVPAIQSVSQGPNRTLNALNCPCRPSSPRGVYHAEGKGDLSLCFVCVCTNNGLQVCRHRHGVT